MSSEATKETTAGLTLEAKYAYYRRCQQIRRNGAQCKAPALKGETICYGHAQQAAMESRWQKQRQEVLSQPGAGLENPDSIQRTLGELMQAVLNGRIDLKAAGRLMIEIQGPIRLQKAMAALPHQSISDQPESHDKCIHQRV